MNITLQKAYDDAVRFEPTLDPQTLSNRMQALSQSAMVIDYHNNHSETSFLMWASSCGGLGLGIASAKYLHKLLA